MWFHTWADLLRIVLVGAAAYAGLIVVLRAAGKRTLAQLNAFDFIVTVALGSTLATIVLNDSVSWAEGITALALLVGLQYGVAWVTARRKRARSAITSEPVLILHRGVIQTEALRRNRLSESAVVQAVRSSGSGDLSTIGAVVLETNGNLSVIPSSKYGNGSALQNARGISD